MVARARACPEQLGQQSENSNLYAEDQITPMAARPRPEVSSLKLAKRLRKCIWAELLSRLDRVLTCSREGPSQRQRRGYLRL